MRSQQGPRPPPQSEGLPNARTCQTQRARQPSPRVPSGVISPASPVRGSGTGLCPRWAVAPAPLTPGQRGGCRTRPGKVTFRPGSCSRRSSPSTPGGALPSPPTGQPQVHGGRGQFHEALQGFPGPLLGDTEMEVSSRAAQKKEEGPRSIFACHLHLSSPPPLAVR